MSVIFCGGNDVRTLVRFHKTAAATVQADVSRCDLDALAVRLTPFEPEARTRPCSSDRPGTRRGRPGHQPERLDALGALRHTGRRDTLPHRRAPIWKDGYMAGQPAARPRGANFPSGPCAKRPGWTLQ